MSEEFNPSQEMTLEEAKAYRAALHKEVAHKMSDEEKHEAFRLYWAKNRQVYKKPKDLEEVLWLHLKSIKMDEPEMFEQGLQNFGLVK